MSGESQRTINVIKTLIDNNTGSAAKMNYTPGIVEENFGSGYFCSAYVRVEDFLEEVEIPAGLAVTAGDYIMVAETGTGASWVEYVIPSDYYSKMAIDYEARQILTGSGAYAPTVSAYFDDAGNFLAADGTQFGAGANPYAVVGYSQDATPPDPVDTPVTLWFDEDAEGVQFARGIGCHSDMTNIASAISGTEYTVTLTGTIYKDDFNMLSGTECTIPEDGFYDISASSTRNSGQSSASDHSISVYKNAVLALYNHNVISQPWSDTRVVSGVIWCLKDDVITVGVRQASGITVSMSTRNFSCVKVEGSMGEKGDPGPKGDAEVSGGSTWPTSPTDGDEWIKTDFMGGERFKFDSANSRWTTTTLFSVNGGAESTAALTLDHRIPISSGNSILLERCEILMVNNTTHNASNYVSFTLRARRPSNATHDYATWTSWQYVPGATLGWWVEFSPTECNGLYLSSSDLNQGYYLYWPVVGTATTPSVHWIFYYRICIEV